MNINIFKLWFWKCVAETMLSILQINCTVMMVVDNSDHMDGFNCKGTSHNNQLMCFYQTCFWSNPQCVPFFYLWLRRTKLYNLLLHFLPSRLYSYTTAFSIVLLQGPFDALNIGLEQRFPTFFNSGPTFNHKQYGG